MTDTVENSAQKENTQEEMNELYETSMRSPQDGNIFKGKVININGETVIVDVGLKSEGKVPLSEFTNKAGEVQVSEGDEIEVMVLGREREFCSPDPLQRKGRRNQGMAEDRKIT